ncbi:MAG: P44/Msp2 family outer membrane protein [Pseudomonadota bacterium]
MLKRMILFGAVMAAVATPALAQPRDPYLISSEPTPDGFYVRAGAGVSFVNDLEQDITASPFVTPCAAIGCAPDQRLVESDTGFVAAAAIGFDYADGIRTELEYRYATGGVDAVRLFEGGVEVDPALSGTPMPANDDLNVHLLMTNFYYDFRNQTRFTPFIGLGVGGAFVENEDAMRDAALAYQGRAGVSLALTGGFAADLEYIYLRTNDLVFGPEDEDFTPGGPAVRIDGDGYETSSVMLSLRKHF